MLNSKIQYFLLVLVMIVSTGCSMTRSAKTTHYKDDIAKMDKAVHNSTGEMNSYGLRRDEVPLAHKPLNAPLSTYHIDFQSQEESGTGEVVDKADTWLKRHFW